MKDVLILGAGQSSPFLIRYLLDQASEQGWRISVADRDVELARERIDDHPCGRTLEIDMADTIRLGELVDEHDVVVSLMPPNFQALVGWACVQHGTHMVSASYRDRSLRDLDSDARKRGILLLPEVGLDPGIDLMSATKILADVRSRGGIVESFESYGSGVLQPESRANPLRYGITWNPRNVVMSAENGACYLELDKIKVVPWHNVFRHTWPIDVPGVGRMEAYPNRDSLTYREILGIEQTHTMIRGTLRYPGYCEVWSQIVRLGLPNEELVVPGLHEKTYAELTEMCLPRSLTGTRLQSRVANYLNISATGEIMEKLEWLGIFDDTKIGQGATTPAEAMIELLRRKLVLNEDECDTVILQHEVEVCYEQGDARRERIVSTFVHRGDPGGMTAMARTVGLPAAIAVKLLMTGEITMRGSQLPTHPQIYEPILAELENEGLRFEETVEPLTGRRAPHETPGDHSSV